MRSFFFFNFILNYANSQLKFKIQASRFWRITSLFSRLQLKYRPKFDQLTHCYTLFTVLHVGDTGKNEVELKEVEVSPVSIAHENDWAIAWFRLPFLQRKSSTYLKVLCLRFSMGHRRHFPQALDTSRGKKWRHFWRELKSGKSYLLKNHER